MSGARCLWVPVVADPSAPTVAELAAGVDLEPMLEVGGLEQPRISTTRRFRSGHTAWAAAVRAARDLEEVRAAGLAVGLMLDEVDDTIATWARYYRARPRPLDLDVIRASLALRANGEDWQP